MALSALLTRYPAVRDLDVRGVSLEEAFVELTADDPAGDRTSTGQDRGGVGTGEKITR